MLWESFKIHRKALFEILMITDIGSTTENNSLILATEYLLKCERRKSDFIAAEVDISF